MINIQKNISLAPFTSFKIGGPAKYFVEVSAEEALLEALDYAKKNNLEIFVLGGGSNILVSDEGFDGIIIKIQDTRYKIQNKKIECGAGLLLSQAVKFAANNSLTGLEWAVGIPGSVGGAIRGNARAFGKDMGMEIETVKALDINSLKINNYKKVECEFEYWGSMFKKNPNLIILSAKIELKKGNKEKSQEEMKNIIQKRIAIQPAESSPGSFFLNPIIKDEELIERFEKDAGVKCKDDKIPAGWLIEETGLKGKKIGGAMVSEKHANFVINTGGAKAQDVVMLASLIKQQVRDKFGVELKEEVQYVGF